MEPREHPTFGQAFRRTFLASWLLCAAGAVGGLYAARHAPDSWVLMTATALLLLGFGGFACLLYRIRHIRCAACAGRTATRRDLPRETWTAVCARCGVVWDLKVGTGSD